MNNIGEQINLVINNLSDKLGVAANQLYPCLRKQATIDGIIAIIWCIVCVALLASCIVIVRNIIKVKKTNNRYDFICDNNYSFVITVYLIFALIISVPLVIFNINTAITAIANPDWYIIHTIISQIKG